MGVALGGVTVTGLNIYPIKSCHGISLNEMEIVHTGPLHDRGWMIIDKANRFITLRTHPKLAQIQTEISEGFLKIQFNQHQICISLNKPSKDIESAVVQDVTLNVGVESDEVNRLISEYLNESVKLVRYQSESFRDLKLAQTEVSQQTMFVDSRPILVTSENSLNQLNQKLLEKKLEPSVMNRFRSNIVISGLDPFVEEKITKIQIGEVLFSQSKMCPRCVIVTMDQMTGQVVLKETLKYLPLHQTVSGPKITFGQYFTPETLGVIRLQDDCHFEIG